MAQTQVLTHALLSDLHKGISQTALLPIADGQGTLNAADFSAADLIYSIKDSFTVEWSDPTVDEILVDQNDEVIDTNMSDEGQVTISANYPSQATAALGYFFTQAKTLSGVVGPAVGSDSITYSGASYFKKPKTIECSLMSTSASRQSSIIFARVQITARLQRDSDTGLWYIALTGTMLTNLKDGEGDFAVLKAPSL